MNVKLASVLLVGVSAAAGCAHRDAAVTTDANEADVRAAIGQALQGFSAASAAGDADGLAAIFAEDATLVVPGRTLHGRTEIRGRYADLVANGGFGSIHFVTETVRVRGDLAWEVGHSTSRILRPDGTEVPASGRYLTVWRRQPDGRWRIEADAPMRDP